MAIDAVALGLPRTNLRSSLVSSGPIGRIAARAALLIMRTGAHAQNARAPVGAIGDSPPTPSYHNLQ
jgi:hypothetical protein